MDQKINLVHKMAEMMAVNFHLVSLMAEVMERPSCWEEW